MPDLAPGLRLGRVAPPPRRYALAPRVERVMPQSLWPYPASFCWGQNVKSWPVLLNDRIGDCTCASLTHLLLAKASEPGDLAGQAFAPHDADVLQLYRDVSGYDPSTGANDNGAVMLDVLHRVQSHPLAGHLIGRPYTVGLRDHAVLRSVLHATGGLYVGVNLPLAWQSNPEVWDATWGAADGPGTWGGHAIAVIGADDNGVWLVSWGTRRYMTWRAWDAVAEECHTFLDSLWFRRTQHVTSVPGIDFGPMEAGLGGLAVAE